MNKNVDDLRAVLFNVIEDVKSGKMSLEKARTIGELTQVVVNSSKVEVEFLKATNGKGRTTGFLGLSGPGPAPAPEKPQLPPGIVGMNPAPPERRGTE